MPESTLAPAGSRAETEAAPGEAATAALPARAQALRVALLTGGRDKSYALGLASALMSQGVVLDFVGSDYVDGPELHNNPQVSFRNLRGDQSREASLARKVLRVLTYYVRLLGYCVTAKPRLFHILWNNKFELLDRTVLLLLYKLLGKKVVFTAHNVNAGARDGKDNWSNRLSLKIQYHLCDYLFVHTEQMKDQLVRDFGVPPGRIGVIPFGLNLTLADTALTSAQARRSFGLEGHHKTVLFFGNIAPYKGLEYLVAALGKLAQADANYRLVIAGAVKNCEAYWHEIQQALESSDLRDQVIAKIEFIPDDKAEFYFKAADVLVLPYTHIFQSGVLFLAYSFGLPVIATDVGSMRDDIVEGQSGFMCRPRDAADLAQALTRYFSSDLYRDLAARRPTIRNYAEERHSWARVGELTRRIYAAVLEH